MTEGSESRAEAAPAWSWGLAALVLALCLGLLVAGQWHKRIAFDEVHNLAFGADLLAGRPRLASMHLPVLALNALGCVRDGCRPEDLGSESARLMVRLPTMAFALALGALVFLWSRALFGWRGALLSLVLVAFNPTILGHGKVVTGDAQTSFFTALALFSAFLFWRDPRAPTFLLSAAGAAGALLSKQTSVVALACLGVLLAWRLVRARPGPRRLAGAAGLAASYAVLVLLLVNAAYLFHGTFRPLRAWEWKSAFFRRWSASLTVPVPLPEGYLRGLDEVLLVEGTPGLERGANYALGRVSPERIPYAFPLMLLLKTPLAAFPLLVLGIRGAFVAGRAGDLSFALLPAAGHILFTTLLVEPQIGIRYLLPALPLLAVVAGGAARLPGRWRPGVALLAAWYVGSTLSYHPHYVCYFNELIGSRKHAYRFLADSNLDWEDRGYLIESYRRAHPDRPFVIDPETPTSGYVLVGANKLVGILGGRRFAWLTDQLEPVDHVGYSYLLFDVPADRLGEWRAYAARLHPGTGR